MKDVFDLIGIALLAVFVIGMILLITLGPMAIFALMIYKLLGN